MSTVADDVLTRWHLEQRQRIERIVTRRTGDPELAADLVSESFARLHQRMTTGWVPDDGPAWLTRVALNLATSEGRHAQVVARMAPRLATHPELDRPEDVAVGRDRLERVLAAMAGLSEEDRRLVLGAANGADGATLAERSGRSVGGARVRLCRARRRLRLAAEPA